MPKRITRRRRWWLKTVEKIRPPEVRALIRAMRNPHFTRSLHTWWCCQRNEETRLPGGEWCDAVEYCLDRTEIDHR